MPSKSLFKGVFALNRETYIEYAHAFTPRQAYVVMARRIAKKQGVLPMVVLGYFKEHPNSYEITVELEMKEVENG